MNMTITEFIEAAAHNKIIQLVVLAIVCDTVFWRAACNQREEI